MVCSVGQQRPGKEAKHFLDCAWATWVCGARTGRSFMWRFWLSPTLSFFLSLFIFLFFYISPFFSPLFFFKQARADTFLKQGYSFGWLELEAWRYVISPTLELLCESKCAMSGSPFECISTPKSIKVFSWCSPYFLGHRMSPVLLNRHLKWLGPRIPEGAYYA